MRILIGADTLPPDVNGAARVAERLCRGLAARGHEVHVLALRPTGRRSPTGRARWRSIACVRSAVPGQLGFLRSLPWVSASAAARPLSPALPPDPGSQRHSRLTTREDPS